MIHIEIPGKPVPWSASQNQGKFHYDPKYKEKKTARIIVSSQYKDELIKEPIHVDFTFYFPIPKSASKKAKALMLSGQKLPTGKPDTTNLQKFYEDCLKDIVIYDDSYVTDVTSRKRYSDTPRIVITIVPITEVKKDLIINYHEEICR